MCVGRVYSRFKGWGTPHNASVRAHAQPTEDGSGGNRANHRPAERGRIRRAYEALTPGSSPIQRIVRRRQRRIVGAASIRVEHRDSASVPSTFERGFKPDPYDVLDVFPCQEPLAERERIGIVVLSGKTGGFNVPAERAANATHLVGGHGLAVPRATQHDSAVAAPAGDCLG